MTYSLKQAAQVTGKTRPTILRAIQKSKISATRHDVTGDVRSTPPSYTAFTRQLNNQTSMQAI